MAKALEVTENGSDDPMVQTVSYSYNVSIVGFGNVFRHCSPDDDPVPHHQFHHRHQYDPFGNDPTSNTISTRQDGDWPHLGEVIREADEWYWENKDRLEVLLSLES